MTPVKIVLVSGLPGSGKSTLAESIAEKLHFPIFSVDPIESSILESGIKRSFETGLAAYLVVKRLAAEQLRLGLSVVIDAVSPVQEARDMWHELEKSYNARLYIIECILNEEIHKKRLHERVRNIHGIPEVTWKDVEEQRKYYLPWEEERLIVDTSQQYEVNRDKVLNFIEYNGV